MFLLSRTFSLLITDGPACEWADGTLKLNNNKMNFIFGFVSGISACAVIIARNGFVNPLEIDMRRKDENHWNSDLKILDLVLFNYHSYWQNDTSRVTQSVCPSAMFTKKCGFSLRPIKVLT